MSMEDFWNFVKDFTDYLNSQEEAIKRLKMQIARLVGVKPSIPEETFTILKWQAEKGAVLGDYEVAYRNQNILENWLHAFNILKANNSVISSPFYLEGYRYRYWIYPEKYDDRIFRKKLSGDVSNESR
ncbi:MAG: hypothetical protein QXG09_07345 [Candidatus Bathyarchaeia archaeon]